MQIPRPRACALALAVVVAVAVTGCATHSAPPISSAELANAHKFRDFTVYWAGPEVDGVPLTAADNLADFVSAGIGFALYYGNCGGRGTFHTAGCSLPLKITTAIYSPHSDASFGPQHWLKIHGVPAVVYHAGDDAEIYTDHQNIDVVADSPKLALAAMLALKPFNRTPSPGLPAFPQPAFTPNPSQAELDELEGGTGGTGSTVIGATSNLAPPPSLEPAPSSQS